MIAEMKPVTELQAANLPVCTAADIGLTLKAVNDGDVEAEREAAELLADVNEYLKIFVKPQIDGKGGFALSASKCIGCQWSVGGMLGGFSWGLAHGEGRCRCGYPGRGLHYIKDRNGESVFERPLDMILQYHPSELTVNEPEETDPS